MSIIGECYRLKCLVAEYKEGNKTGKFLPLRKIKSLNRLAEKHVTLNSVIHLSETIETLMIENQRLRKIVGEK